MTPIQEKWVSLLETGDLSQAKYVLSCEKGMCCLGVAAKYVFDAKVEVVTSDMEEFETAEAGEHCSNMGSSYFEVLDGADQDLPEHIWTRLGLTSPTGSIHPSFRKGYVSLAEMNDGGKSFKEIADFIRAYPEAVFHPE